MNNAWRRYEDAAACKCKSRNHLPAMFPARSGGPPPLCPHIRPPAGLRNGRPADNPCSNKGFP